MGNTPHQTQSSREIVEQYIEIALEGGDIDRLDELVADSYVDHMKGITGRDALKEHLLARRDMSSDHSMSSDLMVADDEYVAVHWVVGTGDGAGSEPKPMGMELYRLENGRIAECWTYWASDE